MMNLSKLRGLLQQTKHHDSDERYMATSDLIAELSAVEGLLDESLQPEIRNAVLAQLRDKSLDVQAVAVKCLSMVSQKFHPKQVATVVSKLGELIVAEDGRGGDADDVKLQESRDIYAMGAKTIAASVPASYGPAVAEIGPHLLAALERRDKPAPLVLVALDVLKDVMTRFNVSTVDHERLLQAMMELLAHEDASVRKRCSSSLGAVVRHLSDAHFQLLMVRVTGRMDDGSVPEHLLDTLIQTVGTISVHAGVRIGPHLEKIVPKLHAFCARTEEGGGGERPERHLELWETCLHAFESVLRRCPGEMTPFLDGIVTLCVHSVAYDPNYSYDDDDDDEGDDGEDGGGGGFGGGGGGGEEDDWGASGSEEDEFVFEDGGAQDDDDDSWKVRRAAARTLDALIVARSDVLSRFYEVLCDCLVDRFKERDQSVKIDILHAMCALLHQAIVQKTSPSSHAPQHERQPSLSRQRSSFGTLVRKADSILSACDAQLRASSHNAGVLRALLRVLHEFVTVRQGGLDGHLHVIVPHVVESIAHKDPSVKADGLALLRLILALHDQVDAASVVGPVTEATREPYVKAKAEALRVCSILGERLPPTAEAKDAAAALYETVFATMSLTDMDAEVREAALHSMAALLAQQGPPVLGTDRVNACLPVFVERLGNEVTRLPALRGLTRIASSSHETLDLSGVLGPVVECLCKFLRQQSQVLRHESVEALKALVSSHGGRMPRAMLESLLASLSPLISDDDLHLSQLALELIASVPHAEEYRDAVDVGRLLEFVQSPLLQDASVDALIRVFRALRVNVLDQLLACAKPGLTKTTYVAIARCAAAMEPDVGPFLEKPDDVVALLTLGEVGLERDLSSERRAVVDDVLFSVMAATATDDEVRTAASHALGNVCAGNLDFYVPRLLSRIEEHEKSRYALLGSLREVILRRKGRLAPFMDALRPLLFKFSASADEGVRSVIAECIGRLAVVVPLPQLEELFESKDAHQRAVAVMAVRYGVAEPQRIIAAGLVDADLTVRRCAMNTVHVLLHNQPHLFTSAFMETVLPILYEHTEVKAELVREVNYGPFKQKEDEGLPLRKAAFQCLDAIAAEVPHRIVPVRRFIQHVHRGLLDESEDVQVVTWQIFHRLGGRQGGDDDGEGGEGKQGGGGGEGKTSDENGGAIGAWTLEEGIVNAMKEGVKRELKKAKTGDERALTVLRSAVRTISALGRSGAHNGGGGFGKFYKQVLKTKLLADMLQATGDE